MDMHQSTNVYFQCLICQLFLNKTENSGRTTHMNPSEDTEKLELGVRVRAFITCY